MKSKTWLLIGFSIVVILSGCSTKGGLGGIGSNNLGTEFGEISERV